MASPRSFCLAALGLQREIDHQNGVFLHDADQQDDADQRDDVEVRSDEQRSASKAPTPAEGNVERMVMG